MVIVDMAARISPAIRVFTLDTGCLPPETLAMMDIVRERYGITVERVTPEAGEVANMVAAHGQELYLREPALRMLCCHVRKVRPLAAKLENLGAWITGLRREQGEARSGVAKVESEAVPLKINPIADWTRAQVENYTEAHGVPVHPLYARGYASIGCAPCTRAIQPGEDERAGRWWWESENAKECGIHFSPNGKAERKLDVLIRDIVSGSYA